MNGKYSISIILPVYNEEYNLRQVIEDIVNFLQNQEKFEKYEIIAIDDGSSDNTAKILREIRNRILHLKVVTHSENLGYGRALISGVEISQYPLVLFIDSDGQFNIREINRMFIYLDDFDIITGYRYKRKDKLYRVILGKIYSWLVTVLFGLRIKDINCGFKLFRKEIFSNNLDIQCKDGVFYTEILLKAINNGYKIKQIPVEHFSRLRGRGTGGNPGIIWNSLIDLFRLKYLKI